MAAVAKARAVIIGAVAIVAVSACNSQEKIGRAWVGARALAAAAARARGKDHASCPTVERMLSSGAYSSPSGDINDPWKRPFTVTCSGENVVVASSGPDEKPNTADDIRVTERVDVQANPSAPVVAAPAKKEVAPETLEPEPAARDTAAAIRAFYPLGCRSGKASADWGACHDETKGFNNVLRCAHAARALTRSAAAGLPATTPQSACGREVASANRTVVMASVKLYEDLVAWLEKNRGKLTPALANQSLSDACAEAGCDDKPSEFDATHSDASYAGIMGVQCTKALFQCGRAANNVCFINKVADRLGVSCAAEENKVGDPLFVRNTDTRIR